MKAHCEAIGSSEETIWGYYSILQLAFWEVGFISGQKWSNERAASLFPIWAGRPVQEALFWLYTGSEAEQAAQVPGLHTNQNLVSVFTLILYVSAICDP